MTRHYIYMHGYPCGDWLALFSAGCSDMGLARCPEQTLHDKTLQYDTSTAMRDSTLKLHPHQYITEQFIHIYGFPRNDRSGALVAESCTDVDGGYTKFDIHLVYTVAHIDPVLLRGVPGPPDVPVKLKQMEKSRSNV
jgi:hypothetical protein